MSHEQDSAGLFESISNYLKNPQAYEDALKEKKALALVMLGEELSQKDYMQLKSYESRLVHNLSYITEKDIKPINMYVDVDTTNSARKGLYIDSPEPLISQPEITPSFVAFSYFLKPREAEISSSLGFPVQSMLEVGVHSDPDTDAYFRTYSPQETHFFDFKTTYIVRNEGQRIVKLTTLPIDVPDQRESFQARHAMEKYVLSPFTPHDKSIFKQYTSYASQILEEIINNKKPLD